MKVGGVCVCMYVHEHLCFNLVQLVLFYEPKPYQETHTGLVKMISLIVIYACKQAAFFYHSFLWF